MKTRRWWHALAAWACKAEQHHQRRDWQTKQRRCFQQTQRLAKFHITTIVWKPKARASEHGRHRGRSQSETCTRVHENTHKAKATRTFEQKPSASKQHVPCTSSTVKTRHWGEAKPTCGLQVANTVTQRECEHNGDQPRIRGSAD